MGIVAMIVVASPVRAGNRLSLGHQKSGHGGHASYCGDGICEADESPMTCVDDCGVVPAVEKNCSDGIDDDRDGLIDCDDPDCGASPECPIAYEKDCTDGIDDDGDGFIDCEDSDCTNRPGCIVSNK